jgi:hypothetical protein
MLAIGLWRWAGCVSITTTLLVLSPTSFPSAWRTEEACKEHIEGGKIVVRFYQGRT